jgi:hypothetical protein
LPPSGVCDCDANVPDQTLMERERKQPMYMRHVDMQ